MAKKKKNKKVSLNFLVNLKFTKLSKCLNRIRGTSYSSNIPQLSFSAIRAAIGYRISPSQIESIRRVLKRTLKKRGQLFIQVFPNFAPTAKAKDSRMGKGKGMPKYAFCCLKKYKLVLEVSSFKPFALVPLYRKAFKKTALKLESIFRYW